MALRHPGRRLPAGDGPGMETLAQDDEMVRAMDILLAEADAWEQPEEEQHGGDL